MLSLADIVTDVYFKLSVNPDNETYKKETVVVPRINSVMQQVLADRKYNVILPDSTYSPDIKGGDLEFLRGNMFFDRVYSAVASDYSESGAYKIYYTYKSGIPSSGRIYINGMIRQYSLATETDDDDNTLYYFALTEALEMAVYGGTKIEFLYPINSEAEETYQLFSIANGKEREVTYSDYRYPGDYIEFRTILYKDGTKLIRLNIPETRHFMQFKLNYYKKIDDLEDDDDVSLMPEERRDREVIAGLVAGELLRETEQTDDAQKKLIQAYGKLISFYDKFATINKGYRQNMGRNRKMNRPTAIIN